MSCDHEHDHIHEHSHENGQAQEHAPGHDHMHDHVHEHEHEHEHMHEHGPDCVCGCHEHSHAHDHAHEHEPSQAHAHEHGPDCACGCHGHEHEHEHDHEHAHEHEPSHVETLQLDYARVELEAHTHEQAATVSMRIHPLEGHTQPFQQIVETMQAIARAAEEAGGVVGHIKSSAKQGDGFAHASVTDASLAPTIGGDQTLALGPSSDIQLVAIVLLIDQDHLVSLCKAAL